MKNTNNSMDFNPDFGFDFNFDSSFETNPEVEVELKTIQDAPKAISETLKNFKERAKNEQKRMEKAIDSEYWFCVCFQSRDEKEDFLRKAKLMEYGDKYLDGWDVADVLGIELDKDKTGFNNVKIDRKLSEFDSIPAKE